MKNVASTSSIQIHRDPSSTVHHHIVIVLIGIWLDTFRGRCGHFRTSLPSPSLAGAVCGGFRFKRTLHGTVFKTVPCSGR